MTRGRWLVQARKLLWRQTGRDIVVEALPQRFFARTDPDTGHVQLGTAFWTLRDDVRREALWHEGGHVLWTLPEWAGVAALVSRLPWRRQLLVAALEERRINERLQAAGFDVRGVQQFLMQYNQVQNGWVARYAYVANGGAIRRVPEGQLFGQVWGSLTEIVQAVAAIK